MGKTQYVFPVRDVNMANNMIQQHIAGWEYIGQYQINLEGYVTNMYMMRTKTAAYTGYFEYAINNNKVYILAYLGTPEKPMDLNEGFAGALWKEAYKKNLNGLFSQLTSLSPYAQSAPAPVMLQDNRPMQQHAVQQAVPQSSNLDTMAIASFIGGLGAILLSFVGKGIGIVASVLFGYLAIMGLGGRKRGLAIAALVLLGIALVISIVVMVGGKS